MRGRLVIIGGGLAGLATAVALAPRGFQITLLESRPRLGGRASSFTDQTTGMVIDNCQHVSLGCCTNFQHFCDAAGLAAGLRWERRLCFIAPDGKQNFFAASRLPAPFHLFLAFSRLSYLSWRDKWNLAWGLRALLRSRPGIDDKRSFADWLQTQHQTENVINRFWHVVLVSALSETLDRIDIGQARKVFADGFFANRRGWEMQVPTLSLDELYTGRLKRWLEHQGVELHLQTGVKAVHFRAADNTSSIAANLGESSSSQANLSGLLKDQAVTGVELRNGTQIPADHVVLAVPHQLVEELLPADLYQQLGLARLGELEFAPISSVHLWFDRPIMDLPHVVLVDRLSQWIFNRAEIHGHPDPGGSYYQVVISAARNLRGLSQEQVISQVVAELGEIWPIATQAQLTHSRLVTEHKAVFAPLPGIDTLRPPQQTAIPTLHLAGDWTQTGWPATMEGAVRSGYLAAESVLRATGRPETLLQPDLPASFLARMLFGL